MRAHVDKGFTALNVRADERHDATSARLDRIEVRLDTHTRAIGALEGDADASHALGPLKAAQPQAEDPGHGLPFKAGWPFYLGAGAVAVSFFGGLQKAVETIGALFASLAHALTPH